MFWRLTLREIQIILEGASVRIQREHVETAWLAWHVAALTRAKKMPRLDQMVGKPERPRRHQSWQEQLAIAKAWTGRMSGQRRGA